MSRVLYLLRIVAIGYVRKAVLLRIKEMRLKKATKIPIINYGIGVAADMKELGIGR
jgi:hypothetical protein